MKDQTYMRIALEQAKKGMGYTSPNPMVGAVVVKNDQIIGRGYHRQYGQLHAEPNALADCSESPAGATMYVTLEPCCHFGKQPPCVNAIISAGIRRVVIGSKDPNPRVSGRGIDILKTRGIEVTEHVLQSECDRLNEVFFHYIQTQTPFVIMKYAMTMDGKLATYTGASQWITGEVARAHVHLQRHRCSAIMAGVETVIQDDPLLTCRMEGGKNPIRVICDTRLRTPLTAKVVTTAREVPTILATCNTQKEKHQAYEASGCRILVAGEKEGHLDLQDLMVQLGQEKIDSVLLEGGSTLNWSALTSGIVQKVQTYIAPKIFGGIKAKSPVGGRGVSLPGEALYLKNSQITQLGTDFLIESEVDSNVYGHC